MRRLAWQIGRNEIKSTPVAYATRDKLTAEQKERLDEARAAENARPALYVGRAQHGRENEERPMSASVVEGTRAGVRLMIRQICRKMEADTIAEDAESQSQGTQHRGATPKPVVVKESKKQETAIVVG